MAPQNQETAMNMILKSALAAAAMAGAATMIPGSAIAQVGVSIGLPGVAIGVGAPVYADCGPSYFQYGPGYSPCDAQYYYEPIYYGGAWYHGPYRWRMENGERVFFVNGGWRRNEWRENHVPDSIVFRNGGYYRGGRYEGWGGAERFNARFQPNDRGIRDDRRNWGQAHPNEMQDRRNPAADRPGDTHDRGNYRHSDAPRASGEGPHN
jgi:hypothetical protein